MVTGGVDAALVRACLHSDVQAVGVGLQLILREAPPTTPRPSRRRPGSSGPSSSPAEPDHDHESEAARPVTERQPDPASPPPDPSPKPDARRRFPRWIYQHGAEPDPRFSLANERTLLAWIRTSLALVATGVALEALEVPVAPPLRLACAVAFIVLGLLSAGQAWWGWARTERDLRRRRPLSPPSLGPLITLGLVLTVAVAGIGLLA